MYKQSFIYILANAGNTVLYVGVTSNLIKRVWEHKHNVVQGFTEKYFVHKLVYYEVFDLIENAIMREKQLKAGSRAKKESLINRDNPEWKDLYEDLIY